jgi:peptide/nickel transport system permease protein
MSVIPERGATLSLPDRLEGVISVVTNDKEIAVYAGFLAFVIFLAAFGPYLAPYDYTETQKDEDGLLLIAASPSAAHPLGTNHLGQDVLSRLIIGARPTIITGLLGGAMIITIGTSVGVTAGYFGGWVENVLMRFTDFVYGVPLIPFAIVLLALFGFGLFTTIIVLGALLWRSSARVLRSQVLQIKERNFILAARATGMSSTAIVRKHFIPNIAPMMILFFSLGIGFSILVQAGLAFIGVSDPFVPSWGIMIRNAYSNGYVDNFWWSLTPGFLISMTVLSAFMFGRKYEEIVTGQAGDAAFAGAG